jgi:t-SNARE complex subunit (syntaxin)
LRNLGFTLEELLDGLANYVETETEWQQAVHHLEEAAAAIRKAKKRV